MRGTGRESLSPVCHARDRERERYPSLRGVLRYWLAIPPTYPGGSADARRASGTHGGSAYGAGAG